MHPFECISQESSVMGGYLDVKVCILKVCVVLSLAPRTFTRCMDVALSHLRQMRICVLNYLDDWLILAQSQTVLTSHKTLLLSHLDCLGLRVYFAKSLMSPSQRVLFLGTVTVSAGWAMTIPRHAASFKKGPAHPLKAFQRMLGLMAAASPVLHLGLLYMRPIQFWLNQRVPSTAWCHGHHRVMVTQACVSALARWKDPFWLKQGVIIDTAPLRSEMGHFLDLVSRLRLRPSHLWCVSGSFISAGDAG